MGTRFPRTALAVLLAMTAWLAYQPGPVEAHPHLLGKWISPTPPGGTMIYEFGPGEYVGNGVSRGPFCHVVSGFTVSTGEYELRMWTGTEGALCIKDAVTAPGWNVGIVDFAAPALNIMNVTYKR